MELAATRLLDHRQRSTGAVRIACLCVPTYLPACLPGLLCLRRTDHGQIWILALRVFTFPSGSNSCMSVGFHTRPRHGRYSTDVMPTSPVNVWYIWRCPIFFHPWLASFYTQVSFHTNFKWSFFLPSEIGQRRALELLEAWRTLRNWRVEHQLSNKKTNNPIPTCSFGTWLEGLEI